MKNLQCPDKKSTAVDASLQRGRGHSLTYSSAIIAPCLQAQEPPCILTFLLHCVFGFSEPET